MQTDHLPKWPLVVLTVKLTQPASHQINSTMHSSSAPPQNATLQNKNGMHFSCKFTREKAGITSLAAGFFFFFPRCSFAVCALPGNALAGCLFICPATVSFLRLTSTPLETTRTQTIHRVCEPQTFPLHTGRRKSVRRAKVFSSGIAGGAGEAAG